MVNFFEIVLQWLRVERVTYQTSKFDYDEEAKKADDVEYWEQQFNSYIQRLCVFPPDSLQFSQAAFKLAATAVALCEHLAERDQVAKPGVPSGEIEQWNLNL